MFLIPRLAFLNLFRHARRSLLLGGAIAAVSGLLALLSCLSDGVRASMLASSTAISTGQVNVAGYFKAGPGRTVPLLQDAAKLQALVAATLPDLDYQVARGRAWVKLVGPHGAQQVNVRSVDILREPALPHALAMAQGSFLALTQPGTTVIFNSLAGKMGLRLGDEVSLEGPTLRGMANAVDLRVVGLVQDIGPLNRFNLFVPTASLDALYQSKPGSSGVLQLYLKIGPMRWTLSALDALTWTLVSILLAIIAVGLMNVQWIAIRERTREIGTLRAIGLRRRGVAGLFLAEAFLLSLAGTGAGILLGCAAAKGLDALRLPVPQGARIILMSTQLRLAIEPGRLALDAAAIVAATTLASLIPSTLAARLAPVTAMNRRD